MNLDEFAYEYSDLSEESRKRKLKKFFDYLVNDLDGNEGFIMEMLVTAGAYEADDYFGTEGFKF